MPLLVLGLLACKDDPTQPGSGPELAAFLATLPAWSTYSPLQPNVAPTPTSPDSTQSAAQVLNVPLYTPNDTTAVTAAVDYACYERPWTMRQTPEQIAMFSPDKDILWPGALITGKSHKDGVGQLAPLPVVERAPVTISIPALATGGNSRTVNEPTQAAVTSAIGDMIGSATLSGLVTPSQIEFRMETYHSEEQFALSAKMSYRYLRFRSSASGSFSRNASQTSVTAHFFQKMYEVVFAPPSTPGSFFSAAFTPAKLQEQIDLGRIGPDNPPVYVSKVVYGRMMTFTFTSSASAQEIRGTLTAAYDGIVGGGSASLTSTQRRILREASVSVSSLGGDAQATLDVIRSGNWAAYFTTNPPLSSAEPLSYEFKTLTGEPASVSESTNYTTRNCYPQARGGAFVFLKADSVAMGVGQGYRSYLADVDGDGRDDLVANFRSSTLNEVAVALSRGDGTFGAATKGTYTGTGVTNWPNYDMLVGDFNNDGKADLVWNIHSGPANKTFLALSNGDGTFDFRPERVHPTPNWAPDNVARVGDVNGDGFDDLVWSQPGGAANNVHVALYDGAGNFDYRPIQAVATIASPWIVELADMDGDNKADLVFNSRPIACIGNTCNVTNIGRWALPNGPFNMTNNVAPSGANWINFPTANIGNVNGEGRADLVFAAPSFRRIHVLANNGSGTLTYLPPQDVSSAQLKNTTDPLATLLVDVNGDGIKDLVWYTTNNGNWLFTALGKDNGSFDLTRPHQVHPSTTPGLSTYRVLTGDINGDGREDILWTNEAATNRVYVALANEN